MRPISAAAFAIAGLIFATTSVAHAAPTPGSYESGGKRIAIDAYTPGKPSKRPALILLHGSAGLLFPGLTCKNARVI